jgi:putative heme-binding domain-containing protein
MWRYHPITHKFEIVAEGTSNPWGWDYRNTDGQMIVCCCVIPHLFHFVPGGVYKRQSGQSNNPYAYGFINEICDHTFHKESGWAHAGLLSLDTPLMPAEYRDSVIFGSIHGCSIKRNVLKRNGSTFTASRADDFLVSGDKNFRPINLRWGPNGEIYVIDWHDQNPCHQAAAGSWDYEHGRVYRIQKTGAATRKAENLNERSTSQLLQTLNETHPYRWRAAHRLLCERLPKLNRFEFAAATIAAFGRPSADSAEPPLGLTMAAEIQGATKYAPKDLVAKRLNAMLETQQDGEATLVRGLNMSVPRRVWTFRSWTDAGMVDIASLGLIAQWAKLETDPQVRVQLASSAQRLSKALEITPLLHALMQHAEDAADPVIPLMLWLAYEPKLAAKPQAELAWLQANAAGNPLITDHILPRAMRRLVATGKADDLAACVAFAGGVNDAVRLRALEGLAEALKGRQVDMPAGWAALQAKLLTDSNEGVTKLAATLAVNFRDLAAARRALAIAADAKQSPAVRADAIRTLAPTQLPEAKPALIGMIAESGAVGVEALRALAGYDAKEIPAAVLARWKTLPPGHRTEAVNLLGSRREWAKELFAAVAAGTVEKTSLNANTVLRLRAFKDAKLNADIERVWGKVRDTPAELNQLIDKMRGELATGTASFTRGKVVFDNQCAKCHKFEGRGHTVGPELDGAGRDIEYILINVLDPNRVVGQPYFIRRLALKNGRIEEGLLAAEDPQTITLKGENDARGVFERKDVAEVEVVERSMMPEGLDKAMSVQDFRDLVRYLMADPFVTEWTVAGKPTRVPVTGRLTLSAGASATASVIAPAAMKIRLLLSTALPLRMTLNGREVYRGTPAHAGVEVDLKAGSNTIVLDLPDRTEKAAVFVRFHDPERKLTYPEPSAKRD